MLRAALAGGDHAGISMASQRMVDDFCDGVGIRRIAVDVGGQRLVRGRTEFYGFCTKNQNILLYARTAKRRQVVAFPTYFRTLVHEFMHHYDWTGLRIESLHTTGFYRRVQDVYGRVMAGLGEALA